MPRPKKSKQAYAAALEILRESPGLTFQEVKALVRTRTGYADLASIAYGRAKAQLGLVPVKPRAKRKRTARAATSNGTATTSPGVDRLGNVVRELIADRTELRAKLKRIRDEIDEALRSI